MASSTFLLSAAAVVFFSLCSAASPPSSTAFIASSCKSTRYQSLCIKSLNPYASKVKRSKKQLALTALSISSSTARSTGTYLSDVAKSAGISPRDSRAIKDCLEEFADSVDELQKAARELERGSENGDLEWKMSNVNTWVSAAMTDENTCIEGFSKTKSASDVKASVGRKVTFVFQLTSNALALVKQFAVSKATPSRLF